MVVVVEVAAVGRDPIERPAHPLLESFDFGHGRSRDGCKGNVTLRKVHQCSVGVIHVERTTGAAFFPLGAKHEVIDDVLASSVEEISESFLAARGIEDIILFDFDPRKLAVLRQLRRGRA
jgi:hypothetical protein